MGIWLLFQDFRGLFITSARNDPTSTGFVVGEMQILTIQAGYGKHGQHTFFISVQIKEKTKKKQLCGDVYSSPSKEINKLKKECGKKKLYLGETSMHH